MSTNPYFTQLHTQRFSFIGSPQQRDGTDAKDQRFVNLYPELIKSPISDGKKYYLKKRPGLALTTTIPGASGTVLGFFYWEYNTTYYSVVGSTLYAGTTSILTGISTSAGTTGFTVFRSDSEDILFFCDGVSGWVITNTNTVIPVTDSNFPSPHIPTPVFLDGYIFLPKQGTQSIYNSALQDPLTWPSDGFIDAEMYPDNLIGLYKVQNYIAAVGSDSIEWFYDNANATGSPLQRNAPAVSQFGSPYAAATINQTERELILVGQTNNGGRTVWTLNGFQPTEIANEPVREALDLEGASIAGASAFTIQSAGHKWYVLNLIGAGRTFVFDFEENMWHEWTSGLGQQVFGMRFAADSGNGYPLMMGYGGGLQYIFAPTEYTDAGTTINCQVTTVKLDFDTIMRKRFFRLSLICDGPNDDSNVPMNVAWSDDDYNTWVGNLTMEVNASYPTVTQLGYSRRRAFQFTFQQPYPLRMESFELDYTQEVRR